MIRPNPPARAAAIAVAILSAALLADGIVMSNARGGAADAFADAAPILAAAGLLKLLIALAQILVVRAVAAAAPASMARLATLVSGVAGALSIAASGFVGLYAVAASNAGRQALSADLTLAGVGATGIFALVLLSFEAPRLRRWHAGVTLLFAIASIAALLYPPLLYVAVPVGWLFWIGLAGRLRHR